MKKYLIGVIGVLLFAGSVGLVTKYVILDKNDNKTEQPDKGKDNTTEETDKGKDNSNQFNVDSDKVIDPNDVVVNFTECKYSKERRNLFFTDPKYYFQLFCDDYSTENLYDFRDKANKTIASFCEDKNGKLKIFSFDKAEYKIISNDVNDLKENEIDRVSEHMVLTKNKEIYYINNDKLVKSNVTDADGLTHNSFWICDSDIDYCLLTTDYYIKGNKTYTIDGNDATDWKDYVYYETHKDDTYIYMNNKGNVLLFNLSIMYAGGVKPFQLKDDNGNLIKVEKLIINSKFDSVMFISNNRIYNIMFVGNDLKLIKYNDKIVKDTNIVYSDKDTYFTEGEYEKCPIKPTNKFIINYTDGTKEEFTS